MGSVYSKLKLKLMNNIVQFSYYCSVISSLILFQLTMSTVKLFLPSPKDICIIFLMWRR